MRERIHKISVIENSACVILGQLQLLSGDRATSGDIASLTAKVIDTTTGTTIATLTLDPDEVVLDVPKTDRGWTDETGDTTGYNLELVLSGANWPEGDRVYRFELKITEATNTEQLGLSYSEIWECDAANLLSE